MNTTGCSPGFNMEQKKNFFLEGVCGVWMGIYVQYVDAHA